jgi:hypothetical protein
MCGCVYVDIDMRLTHDPDPANQIVLHACKLPLTPALLAHAIRIRHRHSYSAAPDIDLQFMLTPSGQCPEAPMDVTESASITAAPFIHQVGGHSACVRVLISEHSRPVVAKPYEKDGSERMFYEHLVSKSLSEFVPTYYGINNVAFPDHLPLYGSTSPVNEELLEWVIGM